MKTLLHILSLLLITTNVNAEWTSYSYNINGDDYLLTIHGYMDDKQTCEDIIKPLNADPKLSTLPGSYTCLKLN
ncbi:hypothetical protein [Candidatus Methylopumilus planktonicus]|uniref:hypothetical protein n=1 Tax=Candidatus Methylopumilus planktonicus TaxID=1581557 RepID=UPI003D18D918